VTVSGPPTVGNDTTGARGIAWTSGTGGAFSSYVLNSPTFTVVSNDVGIWCPSARAAR
jgi:hypothetical protein